MNRARGEQHYRAKLSDDDARLALAAHAAGMSTRVLAEKMEVSQSAIAKLVRGASWRHI